MNPILLAGTRSAEQLFVELFWTALLNEYTLISISSFDGDVVFCAAQRNGFDSLKLNNWFLKCHWLYMIEPARPGWYLSRIPEENHSLITKWNKGGWSDDDFKGVILVPIGSKRAVESTYDKLLSMLTKKPAVRGVTEALPASEIRLLYIRVSWTYRSRGPLFNVGHSTDTFQNIDNLIE